MSSISRVVLYNEKNAPVVIGKVEFNFSYKSRAQSSKAFKDALEE
jgi:predicted Mrr-cat superfamily restriction endonuclease